MNVFNYFYVRSIFIETIFSMASLHFKHLKEYIPQLLPFNFNFMSFILFSSVSM